MFSLALLEASVVAATHLALGCLKPGRRSVRKRGKTAAWEDKYPQQSTAGLFLILAKLRFPLPLIPDWRRSIDALCKVSHFLS